MYVSVNAYICIWYLYFVLYVSLAHKYTRNFFHMYYLFKEVLAHDVVLLQVILNPKVEKYIKEEAGRYIWGMSIQLHIHAYPFSFVRAARSCAMCQVGVYLMDLLSMFRRSLWVWYYNIEGPLHIKRAPLYSGAIWCLWVTAIFTWFNMYVDAVQLLKVWLHSKCIEKHNKIAVHAACTYVCISHTIIYVNTCKWMQLHTEQNCVVFNINIYFWMCFIYPLFYVPSSAYVSACARSVCALLNSTIWYVCGCISMQTYTIHVCGCSVSPRVHLYMWM